MLLIYRLLSTIVNTAREYLAPPMRHVYLDRLGAPTFLDSAEEALLAFEADVADPEPERADAFVWMMTAHGLRQVIEIAQREPNPDLALLEVMANTNFSPEDDEDEDDLM